MKIPAHQQPFLDDSGRITVPWWQFLLSLASTAAGQQTNFNDLPTFLTNAAALAGGLKPGDLYRAGTDPDLICVVD